MVYWKRWLAGCGVAVVCAAASGADVALVGVFRGKAVLMVDGGVPRTVAVGGRTPEGVRLLDLAGNGAVVEVDGERRRLDLGQAPVRVAPQVAGEGTLSLVADLRGHFFTQGRVNGAGVRFLVDTGASMVSMGAPDAARAGIDYRKGQRGMAQTAGGMAHVWLVRLDTVQLGTITLHGVEALVHENPLPFVLLGMSFLNRTDMERQGDRLVLRKRY